MKPPPIGLTPKFIRNEQRIREIKEAMTRYFEENQPISIAWIDEYNDLCEIIKQHDNNLPKATKERVQGNPD